MGVSHFSSVSSTVSVLALGAVTAKRTLTAQEAQDVGILTCTLTGAQDIEFPTAIEGKVLIVANASGAAATIKVTGQTGIAVASNKVAILRCGSADFARVTADA